MPQDFIDLGHVLLAEVSCWIISDFSYLIPGVSSGGLSEMSFCTCS